MNDFKNSESGQGLGEYALILSLIVIGVIVVLSTLSLGVKSLYENRIVDNLP